ncbi:hypothetical protein [Streptomyces europaeiscabiei]|uniref:hypothetical protein n=1 Tax=Streptomyces europaeiscabiei TaxID=146819 RepID=UPI0029AD86F0|nr:hypothetical protein [Streptomyces europaeiscabiei]MDX3694763.1 hypothetical protein [Streptomyces europaeiscabiei]
MGDGFSFLILIVARPGGFLAIEPIYELTASHPDKDTARDLVCAKLTARLNRHPSEIRLFRAAADSWPLKPDVSGYTISISLPPEEPKMPTPSA